MIEIRDKDNNHVGNILDFALSQDKDQIAYSIFTSKSKLETLVPEEKYYPIPLSAFLVKKEEKVLALDRSAKRPLEEYANIHAKQPTERG